MPRCRVVRPEFVRLSLSDGDWVDVVKELNAGEWSDLIQSMTERKPFFRIVAYLLGWSLIGLDGQPLPYNMAVSEQERRDTLRSLDAGTLREITVALDRHEAEIDAGLEAKKKATGTAPVLSPISPSAA